MDSKWSKCEISISKRRPWRWHLTKKDEACLKDTRCSVKERCISCMICLGALEEVHETLKAPRQVRIASSRASRADMAPGVGTPPASWAPPPASGEALEARALPPPPPPPWTATPGDCRPAHAAVGALPPETTARLLVLPPPEKSPMAAPATLGLGVARKFLPGCPAGLAGRFGPPRALPGPLPPAPPKPGVGVGVSAGLPAV